MCELPRVLCRLNSESMRGRWCPKGSKSNSAPSVSAVLVHESHFFPSFSLTLPQAPPGRSSKRPERETCTGYEELRFLSHLHSISLHFPSLQIDPLSFSFPLRPTTSKSIFVRSDADRDGTLELLLFFYLVPRPSRLSRKKRFSGVFFSLLPRIFWARGNFGTYPMR